MNKNTEEFLDECVGRLIRAFAVTGTVVGAGSIQPGALEVLSDALTDGSFTGGNGLGSRIAENGVLFAEGVERAAASADRISEAIRLLARCVNPEEFKKYEHEKTLIRAAEAVEWAARNTKTTP